VYEPRNRQRTTSTIGSLLGIEPGYNNASCLRNLESSPIPFIFMSLEVLKGKFDPIIGHEGLQGCRSVAVLFL
jgi:hypothetical protein